MQLAARRKLINDVMLFVTGAACFAATGVLLFILGFLCVKGWNSLTWTFLTSLPKPVGENGGGMANAIVGSATIVGLAGLLAVPIGVSVAIYLSEYSGSRIASLLRFMIDLLNGVPSIVIGVFAYSVVVLPMKHFSAWAGAVALAMIALPTIVRGGEDFLRSVPRNLREGAIALGATKFQVIRTTVLPAALPGLVTAITLALARIAGETAPLLFTSFGNRFWSTGLNQPTATLPAMIFTYAVSPYEDWHEQAWAGGFVLLVLILLANIAARRMSRRQFRA